MTQFYIGVKIIEAEPMDLDTFNQNFNKVIPADGHGKEGYSVCYPDGYKSWSPKDVFESAYMPMGYKAGLKINDDTITQEMVDAFMGDAEVSQISPKTAMVKARTITGFEQYEISSCVDPKNFDINIGEQIGTERIKNTLWQCLGFVLQWGRFGLKG